MGLLLRTLAGKPRGDPVVTLLPLEVGLAIQVLELADVDLDRDAEPVIRVLVVLMEQIPAFSAVTGLGAIVRPEAEDPKVAGLFLARALTFAVMEKPEPVRLHRRLQQLPVVPAAPAAAVTPAPAA